MASRWIRLTFTQAIYGIAVQTDWDYRITTVPTSAGLAAFLVTWTNDIMALINAIQPETVLNNHVKAVWRGNTSIQAESNVSGGGDLVVTGTLQQVSSASIAFKKFVDPTILFDDTPYAESQRQITHGFVFIPGATDDWIEDGRSVIPTAIVSDVDALEGALADTITSGSEAYIPIVHGFALAAKVTPPTLPARPEVYADVVGSTFKWVTWHESRERNTFR